MGRVNNRTALGGEPANPPYEYLRGRLGEIFTLGSESIPAHEVVRDGVRWLVAAGIVNDPDKRWHEYGIVYRSTETGTGTWYEAELRNGADKPVMGFAFAPEDGYKVLQHDIQDGVRTCFDRVSMGHYAIMLGMLDRTLFDEQMTKRAAQELERRNDIDSCGL